MPARPAARQRLADLMERRRLDLGLTWREVAEAGNISYEVIRAIRNRNGQIRPLSKRGIEAGLRWVPGSVQSILDGGDPAPAAEPPAAPVTASGTVTIEPPAITADADVKARVYDLFKQVNEDIEAQVRAEIRRAKAAYRNVPLSEVPESGAEPGDTNLPGAAIPTFDVWERLVWDLAVAFTEEERTRRIVDARAAAAARTSRIRRAGLKKPDVLTA